MLTNPKLRSQVDQLWDKLWTGGLTNPADAIEQLSYLIFLKRLDDDEDRRERQAQRRGQSFQPRVPADMRWRHWTHFQAPEALEHVRTKIFPWFRSLGQSGSSFERALDMGGRCAVIVPDGVLFGSSRAHVETRQKLIEENRLDGVVSMPGGVFKPYAGVSTAVLLFTKGATTERVWFYDMAHDGFSLDDKRQPVADNDIPDILACWQNRHNLDFLAGRQAELERLRVEIAPYKDDRLQLQSEVNRLTFESHIYLDGQAAEVIRESLDLVKEDLDDVENHWLAPLQRQIDQLTRQFWVDKADIVANKYDLSASRYRQVAQDEAYYEKPDVTMERLLALERVMREEVKSIEELLS